ESIDLVMIRKTLGYDTFYKTSKKLRRHHAHTFMVSAKTPIKRRLKMFGYVQTKHKGVYLNESYVVKPVQLILLNELADTPHNSFFKCFASRKSEKEAAFSRMKKFETDELPITFWNYASILIKLWFSIKGGFMKKKEITPEDVMRMGEMMGEAYLSSVSIDDFLSRYKPEDIMKEFKPEERIKGLKPEDIMKALKPEERIKGLKPEERIKGLRPEERIKGLKPEDIMKALKPEDIEEFLRKMKSKHSGH
ncbi:MAG: hypothetical protein GY749_08795, partial [Desulfobacteraceae bacterium]|nr:hypothetical protein [Desulfobacteraceae bacterium]